ncbi:hypothetical protein C8R45DRAFT_1192965 [Mycena sanguinolenta]|nr:hypothetical protein C8R45DRAFT_1192965 [Mycena sanguinolenta]
MAEDTETLPVIFCDLPNNYCHQSLPSKPITTAHAFARIQCASGWRAKTHGMRDATPGPGGGVYSEDTGVVSPRFACAPCALMNGGRGNRRRDASLEGGFHRANERAQSAIVTPGPGCSRTESARTLRARAEVVLLTKRGTSAHTEQVLFVNLGFSIRTFTWGVTRDPFDLFDIWAEGPAEHDTVENSVNASKAREMVESSWVLWGIRDMRTFGVEDYVHWESDEDFG